MNELASPVNLSGVEEESMLKRDIVCNSIIYIVCFG